MLYITNEFFETAKIASEVVKQIMIMFHGLYYT